MPTSPAGNGCASGCERDRRRGRRRLGRGHESLRVESLPVQWRRPTATAAEFASAEEVQHVPQGREIVERQVVDTAAPRSKYSLQLAEELGLLNAVDAQVGFEIGVQLDDFGRIAGLLDDEIDQERFELRDVGAAGEMAAVLSADRSSDGRCRMPVCGGRPVRWRLAAAICTGSAGAALAVAGWWLARKFSTCRSVGKSSSDRFVVGRADVEVFVAARRTVGPS